MFAASLIMHDDVARMDSNTSMLSGSKPLFRPVKEGEIRAFFLQGNN